MGQRLRPEAWEPVTIVIDPENVTLMPKPSVTRNHWTAARAGAHESHRVWLKARVDGVRKGDSGCVISLNVGGARVSALLCEDQDTRCEWTPGLPVEMHVGQWEAWLRPTAKDADGVMCKLIYD